MITSRRTFFLGIFIAIIPFLGFPSFWKTIFVVFSGIILVLFSVKISIPKKTSKSRIKKEKVTPVFVENSPIPTKVEPKIEIPLTPVAKPTRSSRKTNINVQ